MTLERARMLRHPPPHRPQPTTGARDRRPPHRGHRPLGERYDEILTPEALAFLAELHDRFARHAGTNCSRRACSAASTRRTAATRSFLPETARHPRRPDVARRRRRAGPRGPPRRDHRPDRPQDGDQRAELGREGLARRPGGCHEPHLGERHRGAADAARRDPRRRSSSRAPRARSTGSRAAETPTIVMRPRGWHLVEKHLQFHDRAGRRDARVGLARRLRAVLLPQRAGAHRGRPRPVLLPAEARVATSRRGCGTTSSSTRRTRSASRTAPSARPCSSRRSRPRSRWRRSSTSCATTARGSTPAAGTTSSRSSRTFRVARAPLRAARPQVDHDDGAVHAGVHRAARRDLPQARRACHRRHERVHPEPSRRRGHRARARAGRRRQAPRGRRRLRRHLGGAPRPHPDGARRVRRGARRPAEPGRPPARRRRT